MKIYKVVLSIAAPFVKFMGKVYLSFHKKEMTGEHYDIISSRLQLGDALFSYTKGEWSNWFNPSKWAHSAIYIGDGRIVEAIGTGVQEDYLSNFCFKKDYVCIVRPKFMRSELDTRLKSEVFSHVGKPYDFKFKGDKKALYCFELLAKSYRAIYKNLKLKKFKILDGLFLKSESFDEKYFTMIYSTRGK